MFTDIFHALFSLSELIFPFLNTVIGCLILEAFQYGLIFDGYFHQIPPSDITIHAFLAHYCGHGLWCRVIQTSQLVAGHNIGHPLKQYSVCLLNLSVPPYDIEFTHCFYLLSFISSFLKLRIMHVGTIGGH